MESSKPEKIENGEEVIANLYEHWIVLWKPFFALLLGVVIFVFFLALSLELINTGYVNGGGMLLLFSVLAFWVVLHWVFIFLFQWVVSDWFVTTKRLVEFELLVFVKHDLSYVNIERIHEIEQHQHGILANIFNYGHIRLNLAAIVTSKDLKYLPQPSKFVTLLEHLQETPEEELDLEALRKKYRF